MATNEAGVGERRPMDTDETGPLHGADGRARCRWCGEHADYVAYHDREWGRPVGDDRRLFEKICLEGFQSGLSWLTILRKRENFRAAFAGFDFERVAAWGLRDVERLMGDPGIVRHRGKIESTLNNARRAVEMAEAEGSLARFFWSWEPSREPGGEPTAERPPTLTPGTIPAWTANSAAMSKELKRRGWSFVGPTTAYAFQQAMGLVNDHVDGCWVRDDVERERARFVRPQGPTPAAK